MKIEAINPIAMEMTEPTAKVGNFSQWLTEKVGETNQQLIQSDVALQELAKGESQNLHHVMIKLEQAKLSLQLISQVRDRALTAYQEILKEQI